MAEYEVYLQGGSPWGFRLQGGKEFRVPLKISRVEPGGKADIAGVKVGDHVVEINSTDAGNLYHTEALTTVKRAGYSLSLVLLRPEIAASHSRESSDSIPHVSGYDEPDLGPVERERSKTLPKKLSSSSVGGHRDNDMINTNSLPRTGSTSKATGPPGKAPAWYKQMYKEMHSSMEGESHLTKLLSSDAKRGAFRKYDGISTFDDGMQRQSATAEDAPRRLHGGGRLIANHPHRKSLPNIHAANFNFMNKPSSVSTNNNPEEKKVATTSITIRQKTPSSSTITTQKQENRKSVNSEWYRQLQRGGEIPESGLAAAKTPPAKTAPVAKISVPSMTKKKEIKITPTKMASYVKASEPLNRPSSTSQEYNNPPDFLELRKRELKNKDTEREREEIREMREKERLAEEERLKQQREKEKKAAQEELAREDSFITPYLVQQVESSPPSAHIEEKKKPVLTHIDISKELEELEKEIEIPLPADFGKAKYSFHPQGPEELEFKKGQVIRLLQVIDDNWLEGELNGNVGIFPFTYVEFLPKEKSPSTTTIEKSSPPQQPQHHQQQQKQEKPTLYVEPIVKSTPEKAERVPTLHVEPKSYVEPLVKNKPEVEENIQMMNISTVESAPDELPGEPNIIIEPGFAKAKYTFKAESDTELPFRKGDMIKLLRRIDDNWFEGEFNDNVGILPVNYVEVLEEPTTRIEEPPKKVEQIFEEIKPTKKLDTESAIDFDEIFKKPQTNGYKDIEASENLYNTKKTSYNGGGEPMLEQLNEGLYNGQRSTYIDTKPTYTNNNDYSFNNKQKHVDHSDSGEPSLEELAEGLIGQGEAHVAVYTYNQRNEDEVTLQKGDIVHVLEKCDDGWFVGTCERTGAFGIFPGNYVKMVT